MRSFQGGYEIMRSSKPGLSLIPSPAFFALAFSVLAFSALDLSALALSGCSGSKTEEKAVVETDPLYSVTGNEGNITGTIAFSAQAPTPKKIQMDSDPVCAKTGQNAVSEELVVNNGKLANVFVYVKSGLPKNSFASSEETVTLDQ